MDKTTSSPGLTTHTMGNHESYSTGMTRDGAGWLCLTATESRTLKSERGAIAWLARRGYRADGTRA